MTAEKLAPIAVLTSGGDAPGMNPTVRAIVGVASALGAPILGVRRGYQGLIEGDVAELTPRDVDGWSRRGGSSLGSSRCAAFRTEQGRLAALMQLERWQVGGLIVIGGNGSLTGAKLLGELAASRGVALSVVGIPASIDNDLACTSLSIGVDTALNTIVDACDRILDTASSHARTFIVEVMGRDCGYLAMTAAVATGADGVLFPEARQHEDEMIDSLERIIQHAYDPVGGKHRVLVVKSEGVPIDSSRIKERLDERLRAGNLPVETRVSVLGHVVRGGAPSATDRLIGGRLGHAAVRAVERGMNGVMCGWHVLQLPGQPEMLGQHFDLDPYVSFWPLDVVLRETERILNGTSEVTQWRVRLLREAAPFLSA
ncbi:MAG: 6-phosphofructokinase [Myxococcales bacterium]|nr:6-phosphofructokinase [Myxococcales bacterium]